MVTITDYTLKNRIISTAKFFPTTITNAIAYRQKRRAQFLLQAFALATPRDPITGLGTNIAKLRTLRDALAASSSNGQKEAASILTMLLAPPFQGTNPNNSFLAAQKRAQFIEAYRRRAATTVTGVNYVATKNAWTWIQPPPPRRVPPSPLPPSLPPNPSDYN